MIEVLEIDTVLLLPYGNSRFIRTKEEALKFASFKCYCCDVSALDSYLILSHNDKKTYHVLCCNCYYHHKKKNQINQYLNFIKKNIAQQNENLSKIKNFIIDDDLFCLEEKMELLSDSKDIERLGLIDIK